jgi:deoxyribodipyrimidine photo-lyase
MGIHDMGWKERPIFGKIRFMNYAGCKRKFKVDQFVSRYNDGPPGDLKSAKAAAKPASKKKAVASATKSKGAAKKKAAPRSNKRKILEHLAKKKSPAKKTKL